MTTTRDMSDAHEEFLAALFDGSINPGSGNQWRNPIDGRQNRMAQEFAFAWDGKSTYGKSISIPLTMWEKARQQAGGDRPMLALRWYANEKLEVLRDLVVISAHDMAEMQEKANRMAAIEAQGCLRGIHVFERGSCTVCEADYQDFLTENGMED